VEAAGIRPPERLIRSAIVLSWKHSPKERFAEGQLRRVVMEVHHPSLCSLDAWLLSMMSGVSAVVAATVYFALA